MSCLLVLVNCVILLLFASDMLLVSGNRPPAPVNVSVMHLRADSATVSWEVPEGDIIIGFSISQQRQQGHTQRFIREVNTTSKACVLWDLDEETDYIIQVQSIGLYGESQASKRVHFRTLKKSDRFLSNSSNQDDPAVEGLDKSRQLQTGEVIIIVVVLLMWAGKEKDRSGKEKDRAGKEKDRAGKEKDRAGKEKDRAGKEKDRAGMEKDSAGIKSNQIKFYLSHTHG
uniref:Fibronectin type-III domain-containing protein n=1 Tax=Oncorhynchus tshawytscha TaxID=74940 RepID=A0AAZ3QPQ7_ONCTS